MSKSISILVVDDHLPFLEALVALLTNHPHFVVVEQAHSGRETLEFLPRLQPDVVVMDDTLPDMNGMVVVRHIKAQSNPPYLILLSPWDVDEYRTVALAAGVDGFVSKIGCEDTLVPLIEALCAPDGERHEIVTKFSHLDLSNEPM